MGGRRASAQWNINANLDRRSLNSKFRTLESPAKIVEKSPARVVNRKKVDDPVLKMKQDIRNMEKESVLELEKQKDAAKKG